MSGRSPLPAAEITPPGGIADPDRLARLEEERAQRAATGYDYRAWRTPPGYRATPPPSVGAPQSSTIPPPHSRLHPGVEFSTGETRVEGLIAPLSHSANTTPVAIVGNLGTSHEPTEPTHGPPALWSSSAGSTGVPPLGSEPPGDGMVPNAPPRDTISPAQGWSRSPSDRSYRRSYAGPKWVRARDGSRGLGSREEENLEGGEGVQGGCNRRKMTTHSHREG